MLVFISVFSEDLSSLREVPSLILREICLANIFLSCRSFVLAYLLIYSCNKVDVVINVILSRMDSTTVPLLVYLLQIDCRHLLLLGI